MCLFAKRCWSVVASYGGYLPTEGEAVTITAAQLGYLLEGIDWRMPQRSLATGAGGIRRFAAKGARPLRKRLCKTPDA